MCNIRCWLTGIAVLCGLQALASDPDYSVRLIPAVLMKNVHAVKRLDEKHIVVNGPDDVREVHHFVVTILDRAGEEHAAFAADYSKQIEIRSLHGELYDADGKHLKRVKQGDIGDYSGTGDEMLASDYKVKQHRFDYSIFPYTVEYEIEIKANSAYYLNDLWLPQPNEEISVEKGIFTVSLPEHDTLRYRSFHFDKGPVIATAKGLRTYTWEVSNLPAVEREEARPEWYTCTPSVRIAPNAFSLQDYSGSCATWEEMGHFYYTLNHGRDQLPDNIRQLVHQMTDGKPRQEQIAVLYKYLQDHTRYINTVLGIGGLQTYDARYVVTNGYGDCKALSNYMCALLKEAGITAYSVLVYGGDGDNSFIPDFPSDQFNHVIACVPGTSDTTWLECTSADLPAGFLGSFTCNRPVLITSEKGARLVRTPAYTVDQNQRIRHIDATVAPNGDVQLMMNTRYSGELEEEPDGLVRHLTREKVMEHLKNQGLMPSYDIKSYTWEEEAGHLPVFTGHLDINAHGYATVTGKRMFIEPNLISRSDIRFRQDSARRSDISLKYNYRLTDTVKIALPAGYAAESVPKPVSLKSAFGSYTSSITLKDNMLLYVRMIESKAGDYPASGFEELSTFYNTVYKADRAKVVLVKQQ